MVFYGLLKILTLRNRYQKLKIINHPQNIQILF